MDPELKNDQTHEVEDIEVKNVPVIEEIQKEEDKNEANHIQEENTIDVKNEKLNGIDEVQKEKQNETKEENKEDKMKELQLKISDLMEKEENGLSREPSINEAKKNQDPPPRVWDRNSIQSLSHDKILSPKGFIFIFIFSFIFFSSFLLFILFLFLLMYLFSIFTKQKEESKTNARGSADHIKVRPQDHKNLKTMPESVRFALSIPLKFLDEMLNSEIVYRNELNSIYDCYITPVKNVVLKSKDLTESEYNGMKILENNDYFIITHLFIVSHFFSLS